MAQNNNPSLFLFISLLSNKNDENKIQYGYMYIILSCGIFAVRQQLMYRKLKLDFVVDTENRIETLMSSQNLHNKVGHVSEIADFVEGDFTLL